MEQLSYELKRLGVNPRSVCIASFAKLRLWQELGSEQEKFERLRKFNPKPYWPSDRRLTLSNLEEVVLSQMSEL